jgi:hypothetical protein
VTVPRVFLPSSLIQISEGVYSEIEELLNAESVGELTLKRFMKPVTA